jgi:hypothetical protein
MISFGDVVGRGLLVGILVLFVVCAIVVSVW